MQNRAFTLTPALSLTGKGVTQRSPFAGTTGIVNNIRKRNIDVEI